MSAIATVTLALWSLSASAGNCDCTTRVQMPHSTKPLVVYAVETPATRQVRLAKAAHRRRVEIARAEREVRSTASQLRVTPDLDRVRAPEAGFGAPELAPLLVSQDPSSAPRYAAGPAPRGDARARGETATP